MEDADLDAALGDSAEVLEDAGRGGASARGLAGVGDKDGFEVCGGNIDRDAGFEDPVVDDAAKVLAVHNQLGLAGRGGAEVNVVEVAHRRGIG